MIEVHYLADPAISGSRMRGMFFKAQGRADLLSVGGEIGFCFVLEETRSLTVWLRMLSEWTKVSKH
jgi:hypothetical protein